MVKMFLAAHSNAISHAEFQLATFLRVAHCSSCCCKLCLPGRHLSLSHFLLRYVDPLISGIAERAVTCSATHARTVFSPAGVHARGIICCAKCGSYSVAFSRALTVLFLLGDQR